MIAPPLAVRLAWGTGVRFMKRIYTVVMGHQLQVMGAVSAFVAVVLIWRASPRCDEASEVGPRTRRLGRVFINDRNRAASASSRKRWS